MKLLQGRPRDYSWGSHVAIPRMFGFAEAERPVAELWMGAHPSAPSFVSDYPLTRVYDPRTDTREGSELGGDSQPGTDSEVRRTLSEHIAADPLAALGSDVVTRHGTELPFLLKIIAPERPLSLQVHPSIAQAVRGCEREDGEGIDRSSPLRNYPDANHKPEMAYALTRFEAVVGFRTPRRILGVLAGLDTVITSRLYAQISQAPNADGVRSAFAGLLHESTAPTTAEVEEVVSACRQRSAEESPSPRADAIVDRLARFYPGDPGVVASLLLNPVTLQPGEALFTPAGTVHAYLSGTAVEIMASSDNVLRAGLTPKHMDVEELLRVIETVAAPPIRIAPERVSSAQSTFYVPVDDFELSVIELRDASTPVSVHGSGPRIVLCIRGAADIVVSGRGERQATIVNTGQAVFLDAADGPATMRGAGLFIQADVP